MRVEHVDILMSVIGPIPDIYRDDLYRLGVTKSDVLATIALAYDLQIAADPINIKDYLEALERLSNVHIVGKENLQMKVAMERSLGRYTRGKSGALGTPCYG